jgi:ATP-dependent protease ClpP protease subunit
VRFAVLLLFVSTAAFGFSIEVVPPSTIVLEGPIDERAAQRLREEIARREMPTAMVILNSPGGLLLEGMALGRLIRELGYSTSVARGGVCHSACVFALLGGVYRFAAPQSSIGVHRFSSGSAAVDADTVQVVAAAVVNHIRQLGADVDLFDRMTRKGSEQLLVLTQKELKELGVINDGRLRARWALHAQGGTLVLTGVQETSEGTAEVRLSCDDGQVLFQPVFAAGERADELASSGLRHLMRLGEGFVPLPQPVQPLSAHEGTVSAIFALGPGQLKRIGSADSVGYAVQSRRGSSGFMVDTAGGGAESIRNFLASCPSR